MRYHLTPVRMAIINKSTNNKHWRWCVEKRESSFIAGEMYLVQPLWRTGWKFLKKLKIKLPYDPAIPLLGISGESHDSETHTPQRSVQHYLQSPGYGSNLTTHRQRNG